jgi:hypothetical protein
VAPAEIVETLVVRLVVEDETGISRGDRDRLEVARSGEGRVEEFLAAGLLVEGGEELADARRAV